MFNEGYLNKRESGWTVKWSDLHSFAQGRHWNETPLHPEQQPDWVFPETIPLDDTLVVEFEHVTDGYDADNFTPWKYARIKTPTTEMEKIYNQIKSECELPVAVFTYSHRDFEGAIHPFNSIHVNLRGEDDENNIDQMMTIKKKYGEFFMFFNASDEGKKFWANNPITINPTTE